VSRATLALSPVEQFAVIESRGSNPSVKRIEATGCDVAISAAAREAGIHTVGQKAAGY